MVSTIMAVDFESDFVSLIMVVARLGRVEADRRARQHGMTRAQWGILIHLQNRPGLSQKELSNILEVEPISVARLVDRLARAGLVERRADDRDRRIWRLHLLPAAAPLISEIDRHKQELSAFITEGLTDTERETVKGALRKMKINLLRELHPACPAKSGESV